MKTIYTDRYGIYPWCMLFASFFMFLSAYRGYAEGNGNELGTGIGAGGVFLVLALKRFWDVREAKREGRDATILHVKDDR